MTFSVCRRQQQELMNVKHTEGMFYGKCAEIFGGAFGEVDGLVPSCAELLNCVR